MHVKENRLSIPKEELEIVSSELMWHDIGVKCGNLFTITYSVLWNVRILKIFHDLVSDESL